jgi:FtsZ-binding cell division protein ZapB
MSSSATGSTRADAGDGGGDTAAELERTVERLNQGIVVTYELRTEAEEPVAVDLQQPLPPELAVADVGFRTDAAPAEWAVEGDTVRGSGTVPAAGSVEYVLGLKLPETPDDLPAFPEPELTDADGGETGDRTDDDATTDPTAVDPGGPEETEPGDGGSGSTAGEGSADGPSLVGNTDGELAESVREVIGGPASDSGTAGPGQSSATEAGDSQHTGATATDGGPEAAAVGGDSGEGPDPRANPATGDGLEAAVAAVEPELEEDEGGSLAEGDDESAEEPPELDLSVPEVGDESAGTDVEGTGAEAGVPGNESPKPTAASEGGDDPAEAPATDAAAPTADIAGLADRLAAADETQQAAVREALGLDDDDDTSGTVTVRLEKLESRLSAFEAYEDALAAFIDETGTVEGIEATATEAAEAADELRTEVSELREEVTGLREEVDAAREAAAAAESERAALREDLDALQEDVDEALGLRQQLLGALRNAGGAAGTGATPGDGEEQSAGAAE